MRTADPPATRWVHCPCLTTECKRLRHTPCCVTLTRMVVECRLLHIHVTGKRGRARLQGPTRTHGITERCAERRRRGDTRRRQGINEYQYHEFVAVDRPLTERRQAELRARFPGAKVTRSSLMFAYQGGDVLDDPRRLLIEDFDVFLYLAGWGTRRLMVRLPARLLDIETARRYCYASSAIASVSAGHVLLDLVSEDMGTPVDGDGARSDVHTGGSTEDVTAPLLPVREALASGDLRALYLAWLLPVQ